MKDYMKPCIRDNDPDHLIFHVGRKYVLSRKIKKNIAEWIVPLTKEIKKSKLMSVFPVVALVMVIGTTSYWR